MTVVRTVSKRRQVKNEKVAEEVIRRKSSRAQTKKNGGLPPHWPQDRSLAAVYVTVVFIEVCFFNAVYHSEEIVTRTNEEKRWFTATLAARSFISCGLCHSRFYRGVLLQRRLSFEELYSGAHLRVRHVYGSYGSCDANKSERSQISRV